MISSEEARRQLANARVEHAHACKNSPPNERERCRLAVVRAEERLANALWCQDEPLHRTSDNDGNDLVVDRSDDGFVIVMERAQSMVFSPDELVELGRQLVEIGGAK